MTSRTAQRTTFASPYHPSTLVATHPELCDRLRVARGVVIVSAAAGFGKTPMLAEWLTDPRETRAHAWLRVDSRHADPVAFCSDVIAAVVSASTLTPPDLTTPTDLSEVTGVVIPELLNWLETTQADSILVIDKYEQLPPDSGSRAVVRQLIGYCPPEMTVVVSGRSLPSRGLARLRALGALTHIVEEDLRLPPKHMATLLRRVTPGLDDATLDHVAAASDGWPAGAILLARQCSDGPSFELDARGRGVFDQYMQDEVVASCPEPARSAVVPLSLLDEFDVQDVAAVLEIADGRDVIDQLRRLHLFVEPGHTARHWRFGAKFRDSLSRQFSWLPEDQQRVLHARVGALHHEAGRPEKAIPHQLAGGDVPAATATFLETWPLLLSRGHVVDLTTWLRALPDEIVDGSAPLAVAGGWLALLGAGKKTIRRALHRLEQAIDDPEERDVTGTVGANQALLRSSYDLYFRGDVGGAVRALEAIADEPWELPNMEGIAAMALGLARFMSGDREATLDSIARTQDIVRPEDDWLAYGSMTVIAGVLEPDDATAAAVVRTGLSQIGRSWGAGGRIAMIARLLAAIVLARGSDADEGQELLDAVVDELRGATDNLVVATLVHVARAQMAVARDDGDLLLVAVADGLASLSTWADPGIVPDILRRLAQHVDTTARSAVASPLSARELETLREMARGGSRREVADRMHVSLDTVKTHLRGVYRKLDAKGRDEAVARARGLGLIA